MLQRELKATVAGGKSADYSKDFPGSWRPVKNNVGITSRNLPPKLAPSQSFLVPFDLCVWHFLNEPSEIISIKFLLKMQLKVTVCNKHQLSVALGILLCSVRICYDINRRYDISRQDWKKKNKRKTPWSESASELYRPSDRRFSAK
jgi:hypothetical protein